MVQQREPEKNIKANVIIIGTGFAGIAAAVRLLQEGEKDIIILERSRDVGGVWRDNRYPGAACDVESHLYSLSFAPNPDWGYVFSPQPEIYAYLQKTATAFGLLDFIRFEHEVTRMDWDKLNSEWIIRTTQGTFTANFVVGAFGALSNPAVPEIKGIEKFNGDVFHSATWPEAFDPAGKRIAVIGTGASAIQFIPEIQPEAESLHIFQRTPAWVIPRLDGPIDEEKRKVYNRSPLRRRLTRLNLYMRRELMAVGMMHPKLMKSLERIAVRHMHEAVKDPDLQEKLTPDYRIGCKRILLSNTYYPALAQPNVDVHTTGIREMTEGAVIDADGTTIPVDTVIFGTGFQVTDLPFAHHIYGREGHSLTDEWQGSPKAYMGTTVSGFPNLFILQGPNTGLGHTSVILMIEAQVEHIIKTLKHAKENELAAIEPSDLAQARFVTDMDKRMEGTVWTAGGCNSWYLDKTGRNSTLWPGSTLSFRKKAATFHAEDYIGRGAIKRA